MCEKLLKTASVIGALFFAFTALVFYFCPSEMYSYTISLAGILLIILYGIFSQNFSHSKLFKKIKTIPAKKIYLISAGILLFIQLFVVFFSNYKPITDAMHLSDICENFINGRDLYDGMKLQYEYYLERYSNNWLLFLLQLLLYKISYLIFGHYSYIIPALTVVAFIQLSYYFMYRLSLLVLSENKAKLAVIIMAVCPYFHAFAPVFYTDTISMPFVLMSVYFAVKASKEGFSKKTILNLIISAFSVSVGYYLKGNVAVIGIAVLIFLMLRLKLKSALVFLTAFAVSFVSVSAITKNTMYSLGVISDEKIEECQFPMTHWVMMGLKDRGGYDNDDFLFTKNISGIENKKQANIEVIKTRLSDYGVSGFSRHILKKVSYTWQLVNYQASWQYKNTLDNFVGKYFYNSPFFLVLCFIFQYAIVTLLLCSYLKGVKEVTDEKFIIRIASLGLMLFLLIWETRSRYMLNFLPLYFIMMADGAGIFVSVWNKIISKLTKKNKA